MMNRTLRHLRAQEAAENAEYYGPGGTFENIMGPAVIEQWKRDVPHVPGDTPKAVWVVQVGPHSDEVDPTYQRQWAYTMSEFRDDLARNDWPSSVFEQRLQEVVAHIQSLSRAPAKCRYVKAELLWL